MNEHKKVLYGVFGAAILIHFLIILSRWVTYGVVAAGIFVLLYALWSSSRGRRASLLTTLFLAGGAHLAAFVISRLMGLGGEVEEEKVIRFQAPPPLLEKNFDLAKRPEISEVQMSMLASLSPPDLPTDISAIADVSSVGSDLLSSVLPGAQTLGTFSGAKAEDLAFEGVDMIEIGETAPVQQALSLQQELLNVQDLDIGRYQAILVQDPENKQNIRGFFNMTIIDYDQADKSLDRFATAPDELMRYLRDYTKINARVEGTTLRLSDKQIMKAPFLYMTGGANALVLLTDTEKKNLGEYLRSGGFMFAEDIRHSNSSGNLIGTQAGQIGTPFDRQFKSIMRDPLVLGSEGAKWQKVPKDHPLFFSFYDFNDGPPMGGATGGNVFNLEMLELRGRVVVVFSDLNISWFWGDLKADSRERGLQFGVNLIVFALTQPGGIANVSQFAQ